jgi:acylphosphatase
MEKVRVHIFVTGRVQGVFFRDSTRRRAKKLGIKGWVKNLPSGQVEAIFEGDKDKVEEMVNWAKTGPILAKVEYVEAVWEEYKGEFDDFVIKFGN